MPAPGSSLQGPPSPCLRGVKSHVRRLTGTGDLFACPALQHAGLGYNALAALALPPAPPPALVSLDVSHNALCALAPLLGALRSGLPSLRVLSLLVSSAQQGLKLKPRPAAAWGYCGAKFVTPSDSRRAGCSGHLISQAHNSAYGGSRM